MSCFNCDSENCLRLDDLSRCATGLDLAAGWTNSSGSDKDYKLVYYFNGQQKSKEFTIADGDPVILPADLPKDYVLEFYVLDGETRLVKTVDAVDFDCFRVKLSLADA